ncbi:MAG: hypothetical protein PHD76_14805 [Methylacidiphilales bacterium]|nr:hypothetical protein [Candidatus Methylacidiphilales bacterium]
MNSIKMLLKRFGAAALSVAAWLCFTGHASACAVCFGAAGEKATDAAANAILFLLGVIVTVMGGIAAVAVTLYLRARKHQALQVTDV